jgi:hypothetical protein
VIELKVHCLFEQSGTFKNEFKKLGYKAYDYDNQNEFGQTDYVMDLFKEIEAGYNGESSIFDKIGKDDLVLVFFPCTRFEAVVPLLFRGQATQQKNWSDIQKLEYSIQLQGELTELYVLLCKMVVVAIRNGLKMVIENPYTQPHYLTTYWCLKPTIIDKDRTQNGDYYKKPTQYWFINCEPKCNLVFEPLEYVKPKVIECVTNTERSLMHKQYASRFIRQYLVEREVENEASRY